jgi:hypothetical protein
MSTRTAGAVLAASILVGSALLAGQQPAPGGQTPATSRGQTSGATPPQPVGQGQMPSPLPLTPSIRARGTSVTPALEGWYHGKDGNDYVLLGYFNRNTAQELDIPIGPNNHIDPGGPDFGQPTHFLTGRQMGVFTVKVPKDFGNKKMLWTLTANGLTNSITLQTYPVYIVEPYKASWSGATPPTVKFAPDGPAFIGPPQGIATTYTATMPNPLTLTTYFTPGERGDRGGGGGGGGGGGAPAVGRGRGAPAAPASGVEPPQTSSAAPAADQPAAPADAAAGAGGAARGRGGRGAAAGAAAGANAAAGAAGAAGGRGGGAPITWMMLRGPGKATFANATPPVDDANGGKSETTASFDAPGDYVLRVQGGPSSAEQCCWTSAHVKVTVKPAAK